MPGVGAATRISASSACLGPGHCGRGGGCVAVSGRGSVSWCWWSGSSSAPSRRAAALLQRIERELREARDDHRHRPRRPAELPGCEPPDLLRGDVRRGFSRVVVMTCFGCRSSGRRVRRTWLAARESNTAAVRGVHPRRSGNRLEAGRCLGAAAGNADPRPRPGGRDSGRGRRRPGRVITSESPRVGRWSVSRSGRQSCRASWGAGRVGRARSAGEQRDGDGGRGGPGADPGGGGHRRSPLRA